MTQKTVTFEIDGETHAIALTTNAMARYQKETGETATAGFAEIEKAGQNADFEAVRVRALFWAMLTPNVATVDEAGDMMDELTIPKVVQLIGEAAKLAYPQPGKPQTRKPKS